MATVRLLIALFFLANTVTLFSQDTPLPTGTQKPAAGLSNGIERFKNTEFMMRFNDLKNQVEGDAEDFLAHRNRYKAQDIRKVQSAYDRTTIKFNQVMLDIKQDFMDKEKIKMINKFPQMYSDGLASKINDLERVYRENLQLALSQVTDNSGSAILVILLELVKASSELSAYFKGMKFEKNAMSEEYINQHLVQPNRLSTWRELMEKTPIGSTNDNGNNNGNSNNNGNNDGNNNGNNNGNNDGNSNGNNNDNGNSNDKGNKSNKGKTLPDPAKVDSTTIELDPNSSINSSQNLKINKKLPQKTVPKKPN